MEMTLNLPRNYVEIEEEEMMYLDGGYSINLSTATVGTAINVALAVITWGVSMWSSGKKIIDMIGKKR